MKKNLVIVFLLLFLFSFSQEKKLSYHFDYYTVYDYKESEKKNSKCIKELSFSNSNDSTYILHLRLKNEVVLSAILSDYNNLKLHIYKYEGLLKNYNDIRLFNFASTVDYNLQCFENPKFIYEIQYNKKNESSISINTYKNNKAKKFVNELVLETKPSTIVQNQHYNLHMLVSPLWCNKFALKNKKVIYNSYFIIKGKKKHIRKLLEITKTDFTINIDSTKNTQQ